MTIDPKAAQRQREKRLLSGHNGSLGDGEDGLLIAKKRHSLSVGFTNYCASLYNLPERHMQPLERTVHSIN